MLETFRAELSAYANSSWGRRIFFWSSLAIIVAAYVGWAMLGFGSEGGTGSGAKLIAILVLVIAIPVALVLNLALALIWAAIKTAHRHVVG